MNKESIYMLGLEHISNINIELSDKIYDSTTNNHIIIIKLLKDTNLHCPYCGKVCNYVLQSNRKQKINHASFEVNNLIIELKKRIFLCDCGKTFTEPNPSTESKKKNTIQKDMKILFALKDINKSFKDVAFEFNLSVTTIQNIFDSYVDISRQKLTEVLCVDEVHSKHCGYHKYYFITYSPQLDKILDVLPSRNKEDLCSYFGKIPINERNNVKYFSMDLYDIYRQVAKLCFPNALICAEHFHLIKNLTDHFNSARIRIMKKYEYLKSRNDNWYWLYKKYWRKLLKNPEKLDYKNSKYLNL